MDKGYSRDYVSKFDDSYEFVDQELEIICDAIILNEVERYKVTADVKHYFKTNGLLITPDILHKLRIVNYDLGDFLKLEKAVDFTKLRYDILCRGSSLGIQCDDLGIIDREIVFFMHDSLLVYDEVLKLEIFSMVVLLLRYGLYNQDSKLAVLDKIMAVYNDKSELLDQDSFAKYQLSVLKVLKMLDLIDVGSSRFTLSEVGELLDITRERVRQIESAAVRRVLNLCGSKFLGNYEMLFSFDFDLAIAERVFRVNSLLSSHFKKVYVFEKKLDPISFFDVFPKRFNCVKGLFYGLSGYLEFEGDFVYNRRGDVINYALGLLGAGSYSGDELLFEVDSFFKRYELSYEVGAMNALCALIERLGWIKSASNYRLQRGFDAELFKVFISPIVLEQPDFFSTKIIFDKYESVLIESFDIINYNELHYLLKRYIKLPDVKYERNPHVSRGVDLKTFLSDEISSFNGQLLDDFLNYFEDKTGVIKNTILANYVEVLDLYYYNNERIMVVNDVDVVDLEGLKVRYVDIVYGSDFYLEDVRRYSKAAFKEIGYRFVGSFLIRCDYSSLSDVVRSFSSNGILLYDDLPDCLKIAREFKVFMYKSRASLELIEYESGKFVYLSFDFKVACKNLLDLLRRVVDDVVAVTLIEFVEMGYDYDFDLFGSYGTKFFESISYSDVSIRLSQGILFDYRFSNCFVVDKHLRKNRFLKMGVIHDYLIKERKLSNADKIVVKLKSSIHYHFSYEFDCLFYDKGTYVEYLGYGDISGSK